MGINITLTNKDYQDLDDVYGWDCVRPENGNDTDFVHNLIDWDKLEFSEKDEWGNSAGKRPVNISELKKSVLKYENSERYLRLLSILESDNSIYIDW